MDPPRPFVFLLTAANSQLRLRRPDLNDFLCRQDGSQASHVIVEAEAVVEILK